MNSPYYKPYWLEDNELEHYGVKGMKWGVRKDEDTSSNSGSVSFIEEGESFTYKMESVAKTYDSFEQLAQSIAKPKFQKANKHGQVTPEQRDKIWQESYTEAAEQFNEETLLVLTLYAALGQKGISDQFSISISMNDGKLSAKFIHVDTHASFTTVDSAYAYAKRLSVETTKRPKKVTGEPVSVKVDKSKSVSGQNSSSSMANSPYVKGEAITSSILSKVGGTITKGVNVGSKVNRALYDASLDKLKKEYAEKPYSTAVIDTHRK